MKATEKSEISRQMFIQIFTTMYNALLRHVNECRIGDTHNHFFTSARALMTSFANWALVKRELRELLRPHFHPFINLELGAGKLRIELGEIGYSRCSRGTQTWRAVDSRHFMDIDE